MWPGGSKDPGACREVEESYCWRVEGDVEAVLEGSATSDRFEGRKYLYSIYDGCLVHIVISCVNYTFRFRPSFLCSSNRSPKYSFPSTTSITV